MEGTRRGLKTGKKREKTPEKKRENLFNVFGSCMIIRSGGARQKLPPKGGIFVLLSLYGKDAEISASFYLR